MMTALCAAEEGCAAAPTSKPAVMQAGFGSAWRDIGTVAAVTAVMGGSVLAATSVAGRRTLAQLSGFDVVTIALGTILGSTAVSPSVSYIEGLAAVLTLLTVQVAVGAVRRWWPGLRRLLDFRPVDLVEDGQVRLPDAWLGPQLTDDELRSQLRLRGTFDPADAGRAVLESVGGVSVTSQTPRRGGHRSTGDVLQAHLACRARGDLDGDLRENNSPDVILLSAEGVHRGHEGVRTLAGVLRSYVPTGSYDYQPLLIEREVGLLRWSAHGSDVVLHDGADSYVVRGGLIVAQTIHFSTSAPSTI